MLMCLPIANVPKSVLNFVSFFEAHVAPNEDNSNGWMMPTIISLKCLEQTASCMLLYPS